MNARIPFGRVADVEVGHDYTLADLHRVAKLAAITAFSRGSDVIDRYDAAWTAIAETLLTADSRPEQHALVSAGHLAVRDLVRADQRQHGVPVNNPIDGFNSAPYFCRYWWKRHEPGHEDAVVDRVALRQIWATLQEKDRRVIAAFAAHEDSVAAAASLGMQRTPFVLRLNAARRRFRVAWHEGETPSAQWRPTAPSRGGSACGTPAGAVAHSKRHEPTCDACLSAARAYKAERKAIRQHNLAILSP